MLEREMYYIDPYWKTRDHRKSEQRRDLTKQNKTKQKKLRGLSPQANYTDRATAAVGKVVQINARTF
jgi:hypothetical protein